jgi:hypothetical protein
MGPSPLAAPPARPTASSSSPVATPPPARVSQPLAACPLCAGPLGSTDSSCALCGYELALAPLPPLQRPSSADPSPADPSPANLSPPVARWRVTVRVDPTLDDEPDEAFPCPADEPEIERPVDEDELSIGRHDAQPPPALALRDPGASRRHALLLRDGENLWLLDLGSTNGTQINGAAVVAHSRIALQPGDEVTLGRWTRILVRSSDPSPSPTSPPVEQRV